MAPGPFRVVELRINAMAVFHRTYSPRAAEISPKWLVVDASGKSVGRLAAAVAHRLRGKHKPTWAPHMLCGDHVIVVNAAKARFTGAKERQKVYYRHTGYPGGIRETTAAEMRRKHPDRIVRFAVKGMLPKGPLGRKMLRKLNVYPGAEHPHIAQQPVSVEV